MQNSSTNQDVESGSKLEKSTSTPEMKYLVLLSSIAAFVQCVALFGWVTVKYSSPDLGGGYKLEVGFVGLDPPITSIVFFAALFVIPTALATPVSMFTHFKPKAVLFRSQQVTDSLRGQFAMPFRMKYLYVIQAVMNGIGLLSFKYTFFWPVAANIVNIVLYLLGLALVVKHFQNPNVPTDLASTAASVMGGTAGTVRLDSLEQEVKKLKQEMETLKNQVETMKEAQV
jgi:hypothetical protein